MPSHFTGETDALHCFAGMGFPKKILQALSGHDGHHMSPRSEARWPKTCEIIRRLRPTTASRLSWKPWRIELDDSLKMVIFCGKS